MEVQRMGLLNEAHLTVSPPWTSVALDFAGPIQDAGRTSLFPGNLGTGSQAVLMRPPFEGFFCDFCALKFNNKPKILFNLYTF